MLRLAEPVIGTVPGNGNSAAETEGENSRLGGRGDRLRRNPEAKKPGNRRPLTRVARLARNAGLRGGGRSHARASFRNNNGEKYRDIELLQRNRRIGGSVVALLSGLLPQRVAEKIREALRNIRDGRNNTGT